MKTTITRVTNEAQNTMQGHSSGRGGSRNPKKPEKFSFIAYGALHKKSNNHQKLTGQLLFPGGNPLKEGTNYAPEHCGLQPGTNKSILYMYFK